MHSLFAGIHLQDKPNEFVPLTNIDFERNVQYLKEQIGQRLQCDGNSLELVYNGSALADDLKLAGAIRPNGTVHCFRKTKKYVRQEPAADIRSAEAVARVQELFNVIAHIQINVNSRVNILQKILTEYPEFRRNLGAQALIRDSVLFNTLHQPDVVRNIAEHYPIICEAAPFIVDTIKKELTRNTSTTNFSEPATDSTTSSEEENSLGASSSTGGTEAAGTQSENARIRLISRQQLQAALAQINVGSVNSLSNIAQRNSDTTSGSVPLSNSASGERISSELFRNELQRAMTALNQRGGGGGGGGSSEAPQQMDTSELSVADSSLNLQDTSSDGGGDIPTGYRTHPYAEQLRTMAQMGFLNYEENLTYLNITNGNIENAVNLLMGAMN